ncbi:ATP-binding cassette sub-family A member 6 [Mycena venus]|uniref:ATP-binding cassette sub-family A member 6 n=1 Tax=Mycena venus TaxID=2733690 RepID=A0A8H6X4H8_9AGAR|nr:ATP-binding cassette sub-family A member 6 [Mycena venus]
MKKHYPTIIILFVPGGCTGIWQPLDVGIQHLLKLSMKRSAHRNLVEEASQQIKAGKAMHEIRLDTTMRTLRNRSVSWVVQAIEDVGDSAIITRAFEMCRVGSWNLSQASPTSPEALAGLHNLHSTNPTLHVALTQSEMDPTSEEPDHGDGNDPYQGADVYNDCDVPLDIVAAHLPSGGSGIAANFSVDANGGITRSGDAEASDAEPEELDEPAVLGRGQRKNIAARRYQGPAWEEH